MTNMKPTAIDVFSGAGGLTVGLKRAGFRVVAAVEIEPHSFATYKANHPEVKCLKQDIATVSGAALRELAGTDRIDLLAGCPPCQGFTSLTAKYRGKEDPRNALVLEMARLAEEIRPRAIMMENVPGLARHGGSLYGRMQARFEALDYRLTEGVLQVADYGVPQFRRRYVLLGGHGFEIDLPDATHSGAPTGNLAPWRTVRDTIEDMPEPLTLAEARARGQVERSDWHVVRKLSRENIERIKAAKQARHGRTFPSISGRPVIAMAMSGSPMYTGGWFGTVRRLQSPAAARLSARAASVIQMPTGRYPCGRPHFSRPFPETTALTHPTWNMSAT